MRLVSDRVLAVLTIRQEAAGEPYEGKLAVAAVIRERMKRRYASDGTVAGTVLRRYQFSGWWDGSLERDLTADDQEPAVRDCERAWLEAGLGTNPVPGAVLYCNRELVLSRLGHLPSWAKPEAEVATIGLHTFYRDDRG